MTEEEIIKGNKLIAEFMGLHFHKIGWVDKYHIDGNYESIILDYNWSWDWLMPVIEKIESLGYAVRILDVGCGIEGDLIIERFGTTKIEGTLLTVIEFIKWYNLKTK